MLLRFAALPIAALVLVPALSALAPHPERQQRVAEIRTPRIHFARTGPARPAERAAAPAEPPARHKRKFPLWFLRRHIATVAPRSA